MEHIFCKVEVSDLTRMVFTTDAVCQFSKSGKIAIFKTIWITTYSDHDIINKIYEKI